MGEASRKRDRHKRLLLDHPRCCYCGGERASVTIDHAPPRICFKQKVGPEDYELPACVPCNSETSLSEMVAAFYIRMSDHESTHYHEGDIQKLISAMVNNAPDCLPDTHLTANERRSTLRDRSVRIPRGALLSEQPIVRIPDRVHHHLEVFARKMLAAMFYRETGRILSAEHGLILHWAQDGASIANRHAAQAEAWFGEERMTARRNTDLGTQYLYRFGYHPNHGFFGIWIEFGKSLSFFLIAGPSDQLATLDNPSFVSCWEPLDAFARSIRSQG